MASGSLGKVKSIGAEITAGIAATDKLLGRCERTNERKTLALSRACLGKRRLQLP
jgi:hypothetical protein